MKLRNAILSLALGLGTLGGAIIGATAATGLVAEPVEVGAVVEISHYRLYGSFTDPATGNNLNWGAPGTSFTETYKGINGNMYYAVTVDFEEGDEFKVAAANADGSTNWSDQLPSVSYGEYISTAGDYEPNFHINVSGRYKFAIDSTIDGYGDKTYGYEIEYIGDVSTVEVTIMLPSGKTQIVEVNQGSVYNPGFIFQDGYINNGWFSDESLKTPYVSQAINSPITIYGDWEVAPEDYTIYYEGTYDHAHYWNEGGQGGGTEWNGVEMTPVARGYQSDVQLWEVTIQTEYQANRIIFNNGTDQTENLTLDSTTGVYGNTGLLDDSADKLAALVFIEYFDVLRRDGDICYVLDDVDTFNTLKGLYEAVTDKTLVDGVTDLDGGEGVTIGQTMSMLLAREASENGNALGIVNDNNGDQTMWIVVGTILFATLVAGVALYVSKRRKTNA